MKNREIVLVIAGIGLLVLVCLSLANVNFYLREQNSVLWHNFTQLSDKIQELENEMKAKRIPPISPEKAAGYRESKGLNLAPTRYNLENKGFITKNGKATSAASNLNK